jgi:hypothetical protein
MTTLAAAPPNADTLAEVLHRAGQRVEQFFARAQSLVCLEVVHLQPLSSSFSSEGFGRTVESELRLSWAAPDEGKLSTEAQTLRQLLRVNGQQPRRNDWRNCTAPEQQTQEPQPLSLLLPSQRGDYQFALAGESQVDRRPAIMLDYRLLKPMTVDSYMIDGRDDCVAFDVEGGMRGRIWLDAETFDVLRLDRRLSGMVEIPLPRAAKQRASQSPSWTMERLDTSIRFKRITFANPDETLVLPESASSLRVMRGSGTPRLRTTIEYRNYQRFLTGARVVGEASSPR